MRAFGTKAATTALILITFLILAAIAVVADRIYGSLSGIAEVREAARQFRAEAAPYALHASSLVPNTDHRYHREGDDGFRRFRVNQDGTVGSPTDKNSAQTNILFLGGSTTECNEVDENDRFPAVVQELLNAAGADVRTLNGGVRGHTTQDSLISYLARPGFRSARIVVLMHNINDRLWLSHFDSYEAPPPPAGLTSGRAVQDVSAELAKVSWDFISYRSNLLFALRQYLTFFDPWTGEKKTEGVVSEDTVDQQTDRVLSRADAFVKNLQAFISVARSQGATPVLMTQPLGLASKGQSAFNDRIRQVAEEEGAPLVDLDREMQGDRSRGFLSDGIHFNNEGSRKIAGYIASSIAELAETSTKINVNANDRPNLSDLVGKCAPAPQNIADIRLSTPRRILGMPGRYPSFSKDGRWMTFQSQHRGRDRIFAYNVTSQEIVSLTPNSETADNERHPAILDSTPEGLTIVFGSGFDPDKHVLEKLRVRTWPSLVTRNLLSDAGVGGAIPAIRNGEIFFAGYGLTGPSRVPDLMKWNPSLKKLTKITRTRYEEWRPAVAPDGTIYYIGNPNGDFDILALQPGSETPTTVFRSEADEWDPSLSPDGRWLAFASKRSGRWKLVLLDTKNGAARTLSSGDQDDWDPSFHPNGTMIVFGRSRGRPTGLYGVCAFGQNS